MFTRLLYVLLVVSADSFSINSFDHYHNSALYNTLSTTLDVRPPVDLFGTCGAFEMREASNIDTNLVIGFLSQLRSFHDGLWTEENDTPPMTAPLIKEGDTIQSLMPHIRNCHVILAQPTLSTGCLGIPIGFASYHLKYSGFGPPLMHMEHLFVNPSSRNQGAGLALMNELASIGKTSRCSHMEWNVHQRNLRGVAFYHRIGATSMEQTESGCCDDSTTMNWIPSAWDE